MKNLLLILFILPIIVYSQEASQPFKKANTILIPIEENQEDAYKKIAQILTQNGFGIANPDAILGIISTTERGYKNGKLSLNAAVQEDKIMLNGNYTVLDMTSVIDYRGMKNSPARNAWDIMEKVAKQYQEVLKYSAK